MGVWGHSPYVRSLGASAHLPSFGVWQYISWGLQYLHLTLWQLSNVWYADRGSLPWSVRQWQGQLEHLHQRSTSSAGTNGKVGVLNRVYQSMPSLLLNYQIFCYISFRSAWPGIQLVYSILLFLLFGASSASQGF